MFLLTYTELASVRVGKFKIQDVHQGQLSFNLLYIAGLETNFSAY